MGKLSNELHSRKSSGGQFTVWTIAGKGEDLVMNQENHLRILKPEGDPHRRFRTAVYEGNGSGEDLRIKRISYCIISLKEEYQSEVEISHAKIHFCPTLRKSTWEEYPHMIECGRSADANRNLELYGDRSEVSLFVRKFDRCVDNQYKFLEEDDARRFFTGERLRDDERCFLDEAQFDTEYNDFADCNSIAIRINGSMVAIKRWGKWEECWAPK